ncbi:MAG: hypothetical protein P8X79_19010 [Reinekea sp.]
MTVLTISAADNRGQWRRERFVERLEHRSVPARSEISLKIDGLHPASTLESLIQEIVTDIGKLMCSVHLDYSDFPRKLG